MNSRISELLEEIRKREEELAELIQSSEAKILYQLATDQVPDKQLQYKAGQYNRFLVGDLMWFLRTKGNRFKANPSFFRFWGKDMYYN